MSNSDETLIFLHLPKAGGMTLHRILAMRYPREKIYTFDGRAPFTDLGKFIARPSSERAQYRLLKGHVPFGLHQALPGPSTYITMLRDPVERVISHYYYARSSPDNKLFAQLNQPGTSLYEYVSQRMGAEVSNFQTRLLAGSSAKAVSRATLEQAKENLSQFFRVVGLTEEFDTTLLLLQRAFGWSTPFYLRENTTQDKLSGGESEPRARALIAELNALDIELYAYACQLFQAQCDAYGPNLQRDVARFRTRNRRYQQIVGPSKRWRERIRARFRSTAT